MNTIKLLQNDIIQWLNKEKYDPQYQKESDQTFIILNVKGHELPTFFGIRSDGYVLQIITYLPFELFPNTLGECARLLHILNKELDLPGFCMDENDKLVFYRSVIPCLSKEVDERLLKMTLGTIQLASESFMSAIAAINSGTAKVEDLKRS